MSAPRPPYSDPTIATAPIGLTLDLPSGEPASTAARPRGRTLARLALLSAVLMALLLGASSYLFLGSVHLISLHPLSAAMGWLTLLTVGTVGAVITIGLSLLAVLWCRPRMLAGLAVAASIGLPILTVTLGVMFGVGVAQENLTADLRQEPAAAAELAVGAIDHWQIDAPAPVRVLLEYLADRNG